MSTCYDIIIIIGKQVSPLLYFSGHLFKHLLFQYFLFLLKL